MKCFNCGADNISGSTFCIKCGTNLKELQTEIQQSFSNENVPVENLQQNQNVYVQPMQQTSYQQPVQPQPSYQQKSNVNVSSVSLNYLMYFIAVLLKPIKSFKDEESKLMNTKTSFILTLIITLVMTVINLVKIIFATVRVASYSWTDGYKYSWQWSNLKNIKWIEVIGKNFLIYACIIFAIAIVFYIGNLIIKKQLSFIKSLSITATSVIPAVIGIMILSPLAAKIWMPLSIVFMVAGAVYSIIILYELMNKELDLNNDQKVYFNLLCLGILGIAGYYAYIKLFMVGLSSELNDLLDMFK